MVFPILSVLIPLLFLSPVISHVYYAFSILIITNFPMPKQPKSSLTIEMANIASNLYLVGSDLEINKDAIGITESVLRADLFRKDTTY